MRISIITCLFLFLSATMLHAQSVSPSVSYTLPDGTTSEDENLTASAPVEATYSANPSDADDYSAHYEWRFYLGNDTVPKIIRYEENTNYTFNEAGTWRIVLYATFTKDGDVITDNNADNPFTVSISESVLEFPNAFSPNGDGINDVFKAKSTYKSIVEFHAYIFNRWGQKLYEWDDPAGGWDGTAHGKQVPDGVYFLLCKAKGADGRVFNIRKDVNILRGYTENSTTTTE